MKATSILWFLLSILVGAVGGVRAADAATNKTNGILRADDGFHPSLVQVSSHAAASVISCAHGCSSHGRCINGFCVCHGQWAGPDCSFRLLAQDEDDISLGASAVQHATGEERGGELVDDNRYGYRCLRACSGHGRCTHSGGVEMCECEGGWTGDVCNVPQPCPDDCNAPNGQCVDGKCVCGAGWTGATCFIQELCPTDCSGHGICEAGQCHCHNGWGGETCNQQVYSPYLFVKDAVPPAADEDVDMRSPLSDPSDAGGDASQYLPTDSSLSSPDAAFYSKQLLQALTAPRGSALRIDPSLVTRLRGIVQQLSPAAAEPAAPEGNSNDDTPEDLATFVGKPAPQTVTTPHTKRDDKAEAIRLLGKLRDLQPKGGGGTKLGQLESRVKMLLHRLDSLEGRQQGDSSPPSLPRNGPRAALTTHDEVDTGRPLAGRDMATSAGAACATDGDCGVNGVCEEMGCICVAGFSGPHCETRVHAQLLQPSDADQSSFATFPSTATASPDACLDGCNGDHGTCEGGLCTCQLEWKGPSCADKRCPPVGVSSVECNGRGVCNEGSCACEDGWGGVDCSVENGQYQTSSLQMHPLSSLMQDSRSSMWTLRTNPEKSCDDDCNGHGKCRDGVCDCDPGYSGHLCEHACPNECSHNGDCVEGACLCFAGWKGIDCSTSFCCSGHGTCDDPGTCVCDEGWTGDECQQRQEPTPSATTPAVLSISAACGGGVGCGTHGRCDVHTNQCQCDEGFTGVACDIQLPECRDNCNGHGLCVNGACLCGSGWQGAACDTSDASLVAEIDPRTPISKGGVCPGNDNAACGGNGDCDTHTRRCNCYAGFSGADCLAVAHPRSLIAGRRRFRRRRRHRRHRETASISLPDAPTRRQHKEVEAVRD
ncbi:unnamed protein product [Vitrella brassicaformis CCMP3155]|uniref:EGF-like domain-containing protein n=2 Tax=Vitrella brassicaformis TaxID=1169539 RepID=A0A0G4G6B0_VITBC|nr:unnamed protein product [Vitrella brassicaformis CCMP3155]|eukprot:CEM24098.1 unnamed protein product [Vitrella brassicaformis CCMP3155]